MSYIEAGKSAGAKVAVGGGRLGSQGFFVQPTLFTDVQADMKIVKEEIFGPVGVVIKFKDVGMDVDVADELAEMHLGRDGPEAVSVTAGGEVVEDEDYAM